MSLGQDTQTVVSNAIDLTGVIAKLFHVPSHVVLRRVGAIIDTVPTTECVVTFTHDSTGPAGTLTGGEPAITLTIPIDAPAGTVWYRDAEDFPTVTSLGHGTNQHYIPGEAIAATSDGITAAGIAFIFVEWFVDSFNDVEVRRSALGREVTVPLDSTTLGNLLEVVPV